MDIEVGVTVRLNDGSTFVHAVSQEATPDLGPTLRDNMVNAAARTYELLAEVQGKVERQVENWTGDDIAWPDGSDPTEMIRRMSEDELRDRDRRHRRRG